MYQSFKEKSFKAKRVAVATLAGVSTQVFAAVPADVTTAIADTKADVITIGGAVLVIMIVIAGFVWLRKPMH